MCIEIPYSVLVNYIYEYSAFGLLYLKYMSLKERTGLFLEMKICSTINMECLKLTWEQYFCLSTSSFCMLRSYQHAKVTPYRVPSNMPT